MPIGHDHTPRLSIVMPTRNQAAFLASAVDSVMAQDLDRLELVIVDGASTDGTPALLPELAARHPGRIRWLSEPDDGPNHFDPRYHGEGNRWHDPNVKRMISGHEQCLRGARAGGGQIFNATIDGELEVYQRVDFQRIFERSDSRSPVCPTSDEAATSKPAPPNRIPHSRTTIAGPYLRSERAHFDETDLLASTLARSAPSLMVDVGAHRGTSCAPFLRMGWNVHAFEPDPKNRCGLLAMIENGGFQKRIDVDTCAVGEVSRESVAFFQSEVSPRISGLSSFHDSHRQTALVDITALREALAAEEQSRIKFLKIDTEGHDLFVLHGLDWENSHPSVIECEYEDAKAIAWGYSFQDIYRFIVDRGYTVLFQ